MKRLLIFAPEAQDDLKEIHDYIANNDAQAALKLIDLIQKRCGDLIDMPSSGRRCDELLPKLRHVSEGDYLIFYRPAADYIEIMHVLHGKRDIESIFNQSTL